MPKDRNAGYIAGDHWVSCDICGFDYRASKMKRQWDGIIACPADFSHRQPQDLVRSRQDKITPSGPVRPEPEDTFVSGVTYVTTTGDPDYEVPDATHTGAL